MHKSLNFLFLQLSFTQLNIFNITGMYGSVDFTIQMASQITLFYSLGTRVLYIKCSSLFIKQHKISLNLRNNINLRKQVNAKLTECFQEILVQFFLTLEIQAFQKCVRTHIYDSKEGLSTYASYNMQIQQANERNQIKQQ